MIFRKGVGDRCLAEARQLLRNPGCSRRFCPAMGRTHPLGGEYFGTLSSHSIGRRAIIQKEGLTANGPLGDCFPSAHRLLIVLLGNQKEKIMKNREKLLDEVSDLALQNDMTYMG